MTKPRPGLALLYPLFVLSGAAGLGYQMVWVRMFAAGLGHEAPAMFAVTTAFLGGLAMGAWFLDRPISRGANPARWYGGIEVAIGVFSLLSALLIPVVNDLALRFTGPSPSPVHQSLIVFALPFLTLLPATAAMGATLPAMERLLAPYSPDGRCVGALYAANTLGAVLGVLGSVFLLMPTLGFRSSLIALAALNVLCGIAVLTMFQTVAADAKGLANPARQKRKEFEPSHVGCYANSMFSARLAVTLFVTGGFGIGFELVVVRVLSQVLENTVYTYASALAVYLVGTAMGAALYQRFGRSRPFLPMLNSLLTALACACLVATGLLMFARPVYGLSRDWLGHTMPATVAAEMIVAAMAFLLPTLCMGATFSHLVQAARKGGGGVGRAGAVNTLGCALAGLLAVIILPAIGTKWTLLLISLGYLLLLSSWRGIGWRWLALPVAFGFAWMADLQIVEKPADASIAAYKEGAMVSVAVVRTADGHRSLRVNNRLQMGGTAAALAERRQAHLPLLLHAEPKRALFLGPGTGITLGAASAYPGLEAEGVELVPEVIEMMRFFEPENEGPLPKAGVRLHAADARRFVRTTTNRYDVIVADLFHPAHDGAGFLYTREHFQAVRQRLNPGGLFCQWLPLHQLDEAVLRSIVRTFLETFSEARAFLLHFNVDIPALALVGSLERPGFSSEAFEKRLADAELRTRLRGVGLERFLNLAGCLAADAESLMRFAGDAAMSTDDRPVVLFAAPRFAVRRDIPSHELLLSVLDQCRVGPKQISAAGFARGDTDLAESLTSFIAARDVYLKGLVEEGAGRLPSAIDAYLESARRSLQFTSGYARCVTIIQVMARTDREQARRLFQRLEEAQPAQPLGKKLLAPLFDENAPQ